MNNFHIANLNYIKKVTGASYVAFENYRDTYHLRFVKNGKETLFSLKGTPNDITQDGYDRLLNLIIYGENNENITIVNGY